MEHRNLESLTVGELLSLFRQQTEAERKPEAKAPTPVSPSARLIPVTEWNQHHSWPPLGGLRWLIFKESINGFHRVVRRVGRRVLIDEAAFFEWVRNGAATPSAQAQTLNELGTRLRRPGRR